MSFTFLAYAVFAVFVVVFIIAAAKFRKSEQSSEYDERQILARGKAYQSAFVTMAIFNILGYMLIMIDETELSNAPIFLIGSFFLATAEFAVSTIWNDAFKSIENNKKQYLILTLVVIVVNLFAAFYDREWTSVGELLHSVQGMNVMIAVVFTAVAFTIIIKEMKDRMEVEE